MSNEKEQAAEKALAPLGKNSGLVSQDDSAFSAILDTAKFEHLWRVANLFSKSDLVPAHYKGKPENCMISMQMAFRLQVDPMMLLQNTYIVQGKPGMEAKLAIALINSSGLFDEPLQYETQGTAGTDLKCRAWTLRKGKRIDGPWVTWAMAKAEGWLDKAGSKWKTMPELMIQYRAATFFGRLVCPERLMGMLTVEELQDITPLATTSETGKSLVSRFQTDQETAALPPVPAQDEPSAPTTGDASAGTLTGPRLAIWEKVLEMSAGDMFEAGKILSNLSGKKVTERDGLLTISDQEVAEIQKKIGGGK